MPSTAKEPVPETATPVGAARNEAQPSQPSDAVGAELPVTVHASRYSAASKGASKLPPVHEETRTVIIFPQGAVVRLSATVTPGELVVLTNKRSGADVICRVTSIKTQPGIQNYVNLEFTQRAVGFWEESRQSEQASPVEQPAVASMAPTIVPPPPTPITAAYKTPSPAMPEAQPAARNSVPAEVKSVSAQPLKVTSLADVSAANLEGAGEEADSATSNVSEIAPVAAVTHKQPHILPYRTPRLESFEITRPSAGKSPKTMVLIATAAVVLLAVGAAGGWLVLQRDRSATVAQQVPPSPLPTAPAPPPMASEPAPPITNAAGRASTLEPVASSSVRNSSPEFPSQPAPARIAVEMPKAEVLAQPAPASRPTIKLGKIAAPTMKSPTQLNSSEPPPVLPDVDALPGALSESAFNTAARGNIVAPEAGPVAPTKGGQLQQPKLVSSVGAVYPPSARAEHVQGDVIIDAIVDATGRVTPVKVITGHPLLQQAAMDSLHLWKYEPARLNGEPFPIHIKVSITFHLQ